MNPQLVKKQFPPSDCSLSSNIIIATATTTTAGPDLNRSSSVVATNIDFNQSNATATTVNKKNCQFKFQNWNIVKKRKRKIGISKFSKLQLFRRSSISFERRTSKPKMILCATYLLLIVTAIAATMPSVLDAVPIAEHKSSLFKESNINPYSRYEVEREALSSEPVPRLSRNENRASFAAASTNKTFSRRSPQWSPNPLQYHLTPRGSSSSSSSSMIVRNLTASAQELALQRGKGKRQILLQQPVQLQQSTDVITQQQANEEPRHYQCDSIIHDQIFQIESPNYPATYPVNRICSYYVARARADICQIEITISDMDIEDTPQCVADYLDLGGEQHDRLCGLMLRNTKRFVMFPNNGSYIRITFHSDARNSRPYRGFAAEIRQLPNSCYYPMHGIAGSSSTPAYNTSQYPINSVFGQRLYPPTRPPYYSTGIPAGVGRPSSPSSGIPFPYTPPYIAVTPATTLPGKGVIIGTSAGTTIPTQQYPIPTLTPVGVPYSPPNYNQSSSTSPSSPRGPIYLASYCDAYVGEIIGELRSPGYPFGYPTNHSCIYTIKKAYDDICQLELIFHHFDVQTPDTKRDLTDVCRGDYLELPDHSRLCGYYNQAMSRDHVLKKFYLFPESSDYLFLQFVSDQHSTPDGSGFWIEVKQLRNTCVPSGFTPTTGAGNARGQYPNATSKCDRVILGQYSTSDRIYSPNYPNFYAPRQQCVYFIQPADSTTCEFELDIVQFQIEEAKISGTDSVQNLGMCSRDFLQLPDRTRICGRAHFRRIFPFPKYHDRTAMFYFSSDERIEDRGFEIAVRQLPNTCGGNFSGIPFPAGGVPPVSAGGSSTNVYIPSDPNIRFPINQPTPVFTYHNATGFQPYNPAAARDPRYTPTAALQPTIVMQPIAGSQTGIKYGSTKTAALGPAYSIVPSVLNDPRNVDASGTVPLYFANGSLATRVPPLKPIDMIPFLKRGLKSSLKTSAIGGVGGGVSGNYALFNSRAFDSSNSFNQKPSIFNDRLVSIDRSATQLQPTYNCDQVLSHSVEYIRSPNFPANYPSVTRCIYTIVKSDINVCQIRLQILSMDMEYTQGCRKDYFQIETTGERICGRFNQPETRVINYFGHARDIRLIFNSDRETTASGFEIRLEQIPNSCQDYRVTGRAGEFGQRNNISSLAAMIAARPRSPDVQLLPTNRDARLSTNRNEQLRSDPDMASTIRSAETIVPPQAAALMTSSLSPADNRSAAPPVTPPQTTPSASAVSPNRMCRSAGLPQIVFESDNFPNAYPTNVDCLYKIFRSNRNVCRLEIDFIAFDVGNERLDPTAAASNNLALSPLATVCPNDYLEIDQIKYCGRRSGEKIAMNFPRSLTELSFRFVSISPDPFNGFRIRVRQIDENCQHNLFSISAADPIADFSPATIESCRKLTDQSRINRKSSSSSASSSSSSSSSSSTDTASIAIAEEMVRIQSPKFGLATNFVYEPFLDCDYLIQKASPNVCALEIKFESFAVEESRACAKDYLEINNNGVKLCGKLPADTIRTFDFATQAIRIHFHTDADRSDSGFAMLLRQIRC